VPLGAQPPPAAPPPGGQSPSPPGYTPPAAGAPAAGAPPPGDRSRRNLIIGLTVGGGLLIIGIILAIALSSGDDNKKSTSIATQPASQSTSTPTTTGPSEAAFKTQANATCTNFQSELKSNLRVIRSSSSSSSDKRKALGSFGRLLQTEAKQLGTIQAPEADAAEFDKLIRLYDTGGGEFNDAANAFEAGNSSEATSKTQSGAADLKQGSAIARGLGLTACT
jgi:hypothetical protein